MLEIGKLYICEDYFPFLYPDQEAAATTAAAADCKRLSEAIAVMAAGLKEV